MLWRLMPRVWSRLCTVRKVGEFGDVGGFLGFGEGKIPIACLESELDNGIRDWAGLRGTE